MSPSLGPQLGVQLLERRLGDASLTVAAHDGSRQQSTIETETLATNLNQAGEIAANLIQPYADAQVKTRAGDDP